MPNRITISFGPHSLSAQLNDSETAKAIYDCLPIEGVINRWGDEIYFNIPVELTESDDARQDMAVGELAYWPAGSAFCVFFGRTPSSSNDEPRAFNNVNPFGKIEGDIGALFSTKDGDAIHVSEASGDA
jgi:hypothetical protein